MASWVTGRTIRIKLMFLLLAVLLPAAGIVAWLLAADLRDARDAAYANVKILSTNTAEDLTRFLSQSEAAMATLAARPRVKSLAPDNCDPIIAEYIGLNPQFDALAVGDLQGRIVCSYPQAPAVQPSAMESAWYEAGLHSDGLRASDAFVQPGSKRWATVLSYPIRNDGGSTIGLLVLPVDLLRLSAQLLASVPRHAVVSVVDRQRRILVRSAAIESFIGTRRNAAEPDPLKDLREGFVSARGRDGVQRLVSVVTVPGTGWIVAAGLPEAEAFAPYDRLVLRTAGIGVGLVLVILVIAWRLGNSIVRPISTLAAAAAQVAAGDTAVRVQVAGPVEVESVARQFNRMLDARDLSEARLRGIFESATDAIITLDETQTIVMANPAAARMFRCPVGMLVGAPYERFVPRGDRADHAREIQAPGEASVGAHRMPVPGEAIGLRADGEAFPLDAAISHLTVGGHRLYTAIIRDITEQRRAEAALRESEAHLRDLLTMLPEAVVVHTDDRITFVNEAAQRLFGADEAALIGRSPMDLIHPDSVDLVKARIDALKAGATTLPLVEEKVLCADGSTRLVEATATPLQDKGRSSILAVMRDVTDLRQALSALEDAHADLQRLVRRAQRGSGDGAQAHRPRTPRRPAADPGRHQDECRCDRRGPAEEPGGGATDIGGDRRTHRRRDRFEPAHRQRPEAADARRPGPRAVTRSAGGPVQPPLWHRLPLRRAERRRRRRRRRRRTRLAGVDDLPLPRYPGGAEQRRQACACDRGADRSHANCRPSALAADPRQRHRHARGRRTQARLLRPAGDSRARPRPRRRRANRR